MNIQIITGGRFGNLIIRLKNAIQIALFYNYNIILPPNKYTNTNYIIINNNINLSNKKITDTHNFYYNKKIKNIDLTLFEMNKEKTFKILKDCITIKRKYILGENDLLIHMRSGDIFASNPHRKYIMPPLSYYVNIINNNNFDNIYLVAEDRKNPCINKLLNLYPKICFKINSLNKDMKIILSATNVVMSYGTFIPSLLLFSNKIKNLYKPSYVNIDAYNFYDSIEIYNTELREYYKKLFPWKNLDKQIKIMLKYKMNV